ncbi:macro domain-containing protein [Clostridium baratii]|uniref:macro domain-containing protein n=1 Tax=Clostridium baratii TaxID=1561 RepID=UPI00290E071C|nr:macro domain-containing protein [Clostridium baratii]MDU4912888.1 macro domain-containing protein [Clostridium baratii]
MNKEEKLDYLIDVLISESNEYKITEMPKNIKDKVNLLRSKKVIHTVGPIVYGNLTKELEEDLSNCYKSCLEIALENNICSIAFCCISTGEFRFPNKRAAQIAIETVINFINENDYEFDRIIFNVFKDIDRDIYETLLKSL